ncbi:MAG: carboxypeptidase-like regulatory domain-containing protein [Isosphaeraceae bacterium]
MPSTGLRTSPQAAGILWPRGFTLLMFLLGSVNCGGPGPYSGALYPVKGRVLLADGMPLTGGLVQFIPMEGGLPASGVIGPDGTFSLKSLKTRQGAAPGQYRVRIEPSAELRVKKGKTKKKLPFAPKYSEYDGETGLTATINSAATQLEPFRLVAD